MERAPLPPHERTWRHPSELAPARLDVEPDGHSRSAMLASGTLAVLMVAALVVAVTPRASNAPSAISATTTPMSAQATTATPVEVAASSVRLSSFNAIPNGIAAVPQPVADQTTPLGPVDLPDLDDDVVVLTDDHVYVVRWRDVGLLGVDNGLVLTDSGSVVAHLDGGRLVVVPHSDD